jgi:C1A family cysteine protease
LKEPFSIETSVEDLVKMVKESTKDRTFKKEYDRLGQLISETRVGVVTQKLVKDEKTGIPTLQDQLPKDLKTSWEYSPTQKITKITYEDGSVERLFYDACDTKIAETKVPRESKDEKENNITMVPLTLYKPNAHGQIAVVQKSTEGAVLNDSKQGFSLELKGDLIQDIALHDNRGLTKTTQNALNNTKHFTYSPTRKIAREIQEVTTWTSDEKKTINKVKNIDEKQTKFDKQDRPRQSSILRNGVLEQDT